MKSDLHLSITQVPEIVGRLYAVVDELERLFPGRHFTPDGHLVGSLGEVWAAYLYGIDLSSASTSKHDGRAPDGRLVQIKATQGDSVALRAEPDYLIVLKLGRHGDPVEIFNGPGAAPWSRAGGVQSNGQRTVRLSALQAIMKTVPQERRIELANTGLEPTTWN